MNVEQEKRYAMKIFVLTIFLFVLAIVSIVYACVSFFNGEPINNNIFELIFFIGHLFIVFMAAYFAFMAKNKGLYVLKKIMYTEHKIKSQKALVIAIVLTVIAFLAFVYFTLAFFLPSLPRFNFPITLMLILINTPLTVWSLGLFFIFYPVINEKEKNKSKGTN